MLDRYITIRSMSALDTGARSTDFGVMIDKINDGTIAERDVEIVAVPGRDGDLIIDKKRYKAVPREITCSIAHDFYANYRRLIAVLSRYTSTYCRLYDSYDPDVYTLVRFIGAEITLITPTRDSGSFTLRFSAQPYRYHISGDTKIEIPAGQRIALSAPMSIAATYPKITIDGTLTTTLASGYIGIGLNDRIRIKNPIELFGTGGIVIDCEHAIAYDAIFMSGYTQNLEFSAALEIEDGTYIDNRTNAPIAVQPGWRAL